MSSSIALENSATAGERTKTLDSPGRRYIAAIARDGRETMAFIGFREIAIADSLSLRQSVFAFFLSKSHEINETRILSANAHTSRELLSSSADPAWRGGRVPFSSGISTSGLARKPATIRAAEDRWKDRNLLERKTLQRGFELDGERVPLQAPQGIFKPRICRFPLSITTVPVTEGQPRPYDDAFGGDGLLRYRYRGIDPNHHDNRGLREAMRQRLPLIYFHGIVEGKYEADYPVFVVGDSPESLTFTVSVDERRFASMGNVSDDPVETDIRRRYVTRTVQHRLHQQEFRERVLEAYDGAARLPHRSSTGRARRVRRSDAGPRPAGISRPAH